MLDAYWYVIDDKKETIYNHILLIHAHVLYGGNDYLIQVIIRFQQFFKLILNVCHLRLLNGEFREGNFCFLQIEQKANFCRSKEEKSMAFALAVSTTSSTDSEDIFQQNKWKSLCLPVDVFFGIIWGIVLDNPIDGWDIQTSSSDVSTEHNACFSVTELEVGRSSLRLLLFSVN